MKELDLSNYKNNLGFKHQLLRFVWIIVWFFFAKPFPRSTGRKWKLFLLRIFGASVHDTANVYSTAKIYAPWNLEMHEYSCIASEVDCYNVDKLIMEKHTVVSQKSFLCTASHDISDSSYPLITAPIIIKEKSWVGASSFIGMGVTVGEGAVVGATSSVYNDVREWTVVGGNPAKFLKKRIIND